MSNPLAIAGGLFPLTPTLSLGERENGRLSVGESETLSLFENRTPRLPLPGGEGRGEGEQVLRTPSAYRKGGQTRGRNQRGLGTLQSVRWSETCCARGQARSEGGIP